MASEPIIDRAVLDQLIARGRRQGRLSTDDLRAALPVTSLTAEDLAMIVVEIEEAGVPVELSDDLLALAGSAPRPSSVPPPLPAIDLPPTTTVPPTARPVDTVLGSGPPPTPERAHRQVEAAASGGWSPWTIILIGVLAIALIFVLLYSLA
jgi:hypothetical protein